MSDEPKSPTAKHAWELALKAQREGNHAKALVLAISAGAIDAYVREMNRPSPLVKLLRNK